MSTYAHNRSHVLSFYDLDTEDQIDLFNDYDNPEEELFIATPKNNGYVALSSFMRTDHSRYDGIMELSNSSAYGIIFSDDDDQAIIALIG